MFTMDRSKNSFVIFSTFAALSVLLTGTQSTSHTEFEEIGIYSQRDHSLTKPYQGSGMTIPNWDFAGHTMVTTSFIRLTPDQQSRQGGIWNKLPLNFPFWEVQLEFKITGHGKELYGDGMAFWYVKHPNQPGNVFGSADFFSGLAIFLDTYANQNGAHSHSHPYISAMVNNATQRYDHDRDGTHTELAGCEGKFRNVEHDTYLSIRYYNDTLTVQTDFDGTGNWELCFVSEGVRLPTGYYLGVTAATGDLSDNHDLMSIKTYVLDAPPSTSPVEDRSLIVPSAQNAAPHRDHVDDIPASMSWIKFFFYILLSVIGLAVVGGAAFFFYQKKQQNSRKRFY